MPRQDVVSVHGRSLAADFAGMAICCRNLVRRAHGSGARAARAGLAFALAVLSLSAPADAADRLVCAHPFSDAHPLVQGFLLPWASGVTTDASGALRVDVVAADPSEHPCSFAPVTSPVADAISLPFALVDDAEVASQIVFAALEAEGQVAGLIAGAALGHVIISGPSTSDAPVPGGLERHSLAAPTPPVAGVLDVLGARLAQEDSTEPTAHIGTLADWPDSRWIATLDAGRSLYTRPYALRIAPSYLDALPVSSRSLLTQNAGRSLSAMAGRALNRSGAVVLERAQASGRHVSLAEDRVGAALAAAARLTEAWAAQNDPQSTARALLDAARARATGPMR